jgi:hypothetical protein
MPELRVCTYDVDGVIQQQQLALATPPAFAFHRNLANHLLSGEELAVPPQQARRNITVMEAAKRSAGQGGRTIDLSC